MKLYLRALSHALVMFLTFMLLTALVSMFDPTDCFDDPMFYLADTKMDCAVKR